MKLKTFAILAAALVLAACGGGGGGSSTPPPPTDTTPPTFTLSSNTANAVVVKASEPIMAAGAAITVSDGATTKSGGTTLGTDAMTLTWTSTSGDLACGKTYTVSPSGTDLAGNASKPASLSVTTAACPTQTLHYTDVVLAMSDLYGAYPVKMTLVSGATSGTPTFTADKAVNATQWQTGVFPLFNCAYNKVKLSNGAVKLSCQDAVNKIARNLAWDPVANQITEYTGSEAYPPITDSTWVDVQTDTPPFAGWSRFAEITAGWVWNPTTNEQEIHFKRKSDGSDTVLPLNIGRIKAFAAFSN